MRTSSPQPTSGFTLIEVMVGLLVLSIGLLGIAGLQIKAKQATSDATQRTAAAMLANEIIERMRANPGEVDNKYLIALDSAITATNTQNAAGDNFGTFAPDNDQCIDSASACTTANIALFDLKAWHNDLQGASELLNGVNTGGLVQPAACITTTAAGSGDYQLHIAWRGKTKLANPTISTCGENTGFYDDVAGDNVYRRLIVIPFRISQVL